MHKVTTFILVLLVTAGCSSGNSVVNHQTFELTNEQKVRQKELISELHPWRFEGKPASDYHELLSLADELKTKGIVSQYRFSKVGEGDDGSDTPLVIRVDNKVIVDVHYAPITY